MNGGAHPTISRAALRTGRILAATLLLLGIGSCLVAFVAAPPEYLAWDRMVLLDATARWLGGGSPYPPFQLTGPFTAGGAGNWTPTVLYPPPAFVLFAPFLLLPAVAWYAIPIGIVAWSVYRSRPRPWAVAVIGVVLLLPTTWTLLVWGNATMLVAALVALGLRWPVFAPLVLVKPTLAPLALPGIRSRSWWVGAGLLALVSLALLPLWGEWLTSIRNVTNSGLGYLDHLPVAAIPLVAWLGRHALDPNRDVRVVVVPRPDLPHGAQP
jgi:hypothetical protein